MKAIITIILVLCTATVFAQSTAGTSKPSTDTDKPKIGSKTDIRNPFDTTKVKAKSQAKRKEAGWGDVGAAKENNSYVGETEKNRNNATRTDANRKPEANNLGVGEDPFGKTKVNKPNKVSDGEDPFGKTKKSDSPKKKNGYANQEVSY